VDIDAIAEAMREALNMPLGLRQERWKAMMQVLRRNDITAWRKQFVRALAESAAERA